MHADLHKRTDRSCRSHVTGICILRKFACLAYIGSSGWHTISKCLIGNASSVSVPVRDIQSNFGTLDNNAHIETFRLREGQQSVKMTATTNYGTCARGRYLLTSMRPCILNDEQFHPFFSTLHQTFFPMRPENY